MRRAFLAGTLLALGLAIGSACCSAATEPDDAPATERIRWDKVSIRVTLRVGFERRVSFPAAVRVGMPPALAGRVRTQSIDGTVYWLARESFEAHRVQVQEIETGRMYLLDLQARQEEGNNAPLEIFAPRTTSGAGDATAVPAAPPARPGYVSLTRFAAQQLYAPKRLLRPLPGVFRVPLAIRTPVALVRGGWLTATFQHARLLPAGDEADTTCVYLISARPFHESL